MSPTKISGLPTGTVTSDDYIVFVDQADNTTKKAPVSGLPASGDSVTSASTLTDNAIIRGDGGAKGIQTSGVTIDDSNNVVVPGNVSVIPTSGIGRMIVSAANNVGKLFSWRTNNVARWAARVDGDETGANAGGDWALRRYDDAGTFIDNVLSFVRSTGAGTMKSLTVEGNIELSNSDTTLSRSSAGVLAVEGVVIPSVSSTNDLTNKSFKPVTLDSNYSATFKNLAGTTVAGVRGDGDAVSGTDLMTLTETGEFVFQAVTNGTYTLNNKTLEIGGTAGNTVFGTAADWNLCVSDDLFVFGGGTCTGTMSGTSSGTNTGDHEDGWQPAGETWTYASATTFTVTGDVSSKYQRGDRIQLTQSATVKYFVILKVAVSGNTTITITGGTSYTLANSAISSNSYSKAVSPQGYPDWFSFTPVWTGFSADPTVDFAQFRITGSTCDLRISCSANGTSNSTSFSVGTPNSITSVGQAQGAVGFPVDNGTGISAAYSSITDTAKTVAFRKTMDTSTSWTASGGKRANLTISFRYTL